jgi:flagellar protein FliO/FliZ
MREALVPIFGENGAVAVQYIITLVVILALIGGVVLLVRRYAGGSTGPTSRNRLPRLAIVETLPVDNRRRLLLVRRDNVEHLVLIGGPTDIVVEPSIVRTRVAQRPGQTPAVRGPAQPGANAPQPAPPPPPNRSAPPAPSRGTSIRSRRAEPPAEDPIPFPPRASPTRPPVRPDPETTTFRSRIAPEPPVRLAEPTMIDPPRDDRPGVDMAKALVAAESEAAAPPRPELPRPHESESPFAPAAKTPLPDADEAPPARPEPAEPVPPVPPRAAGREEPPRRPPGELHRREEDEEGASAVGNLERDMARLLGQISNGRSN